MVGNEWMVAPVLSPGSETVNLYLPKGNWVNLWTGEQLQSSGAFYEVLGLKDRPAVMYQKGSKVTERFIMELKQQDVEVPNIINLSN